MRTFEELQADLGPAWALNRPGATVPHVLVALPSFGVGESVLAHYADRIAALEHRYLVAHLMLGRIPGCELVFLTCQDPGPEILDYYAALAPAAEVGSRFRVVTVPDGSPRSIAAKLLERPDLLADLRRSFRGRPVLIEPWNVTDPEVAVAVALQAPVNGTAPALWPLGYKSAGRRLLAAVGVPVPFGREDVRTVDDVVGALAALQAARPGATGAVVKHDNSTAGDGNAVLALRHPDGAAATAAQLRAQVEALPEWYRRDLGAGGVVEELVTGVRVASPSVQGDISPYGEVTVLATHEQVLGGSSGQVYTGCRFPADPAYAPELAGYGRAVGERLAELGAVGRFGVDFLASADPAGRWDLRALEINLRKGGTAHPFTVLRHLVPGHYDVESGRWATKDGTARAYCATDNLVDPGWRGLPPVGVIAAVADAGLAFDPDRGTGVVLHMLSCLAVDGRFGVTAVGDTPEHAAELYAATGAAVAALSAARPPLTGPRTPPRFAPAP